MLSNVFWKTKCEPPKVTPSDNTLLAGTSGGSSFPKSRPSIGYYKSSFELVCDRSENVGNYNVRKTNNRTLRCPLIVYFILSAKDHAAY